MQRRSRRCRMIVSRGDFKKMTSSWSRLHLIWCLPGSSRRKDSRRYTSQGWNSPPLTRDCPMPTRCQAVLLRPIEDSMWMTDGTLLNGKDGGLRNGSQMGSRQKRGNERRISISYEGDVNDGRAHQNRHQPMSARR
jgi:hypothetical protein